MTREEVEAMIKKKFPKEGAEVSKVFMPLVVALEYYKNTSLSLMAPTVLKKFIEDLQNESKR